MYYIGLMSGTSADGTDAVLASFPADSPAKVEKSITRPFNDKLRQEIFTLAAAGDNEIERLGALGNRLAREYALCVSDLLAGSDVNASDVIAIGSHGQTLRHQPDIALPFSLQIGNPSLVAELTGITTVADFRARDIAAGGQGAPLVPAFHAAAFHSPQAARCIINIGGIANISILPADADAPIIGFDTGPGNTLLDGWITENEGSAYDKQGAWAADGKIEPALLEQLLSDAYFALKPPKSTGKEQFNLGWLNEKLVKLSLKPAAVDVQATLVALTATSIANAIKAQAVDCNQAYVCGGGSHNRSLMLALEQALAPLTLGTTADLGIDPDVVEAMAFAWLAKQTVDGKTGNLPSVTGAKHAVILGGIYPA